jgi:WD40 repeat protein
MRIVGRLVPQWLLARAALATVIISCSGASDSMAPPVPTRINLAPNSPTVPQGLTLQLVATVVDDRGRAIAGQVLQYTSSNQVAATVDATGLVTSLGPLGSTRITVTLGRLSAHVDVTIVQRITGVTVTPDPLVLNTMTAEPLTVTAKTYTGAQAILAAPPTFTSSNTSLVTVNSSGLVISSSTAEGNATVTVTADTFSIPVPVQVTQIAGSMALGASLIVLNPGTSEQLKVTVQDVVGRTINHPAVSYTSGSPGIFSVSATGLLTSVGPLGQGTLTVTSDTVTQRLPVDVVTAGIPAGLVVRTIPVPGSAYASAVAGNGRTAVTLLGGKLVTGSVASYGFSDTLSLTDTPLGVAINPAGTRAWVAMGGTVAVVDIATGAVTTPISGLSGANVLSVVLSPDRTLLFIGADDGVYKVQLSNNKIVGSTPAGCALHLAAHPTQPLLYASMNCGGEIEEINTTTMAVVRTLGTLGEAQALAVSPDGAMLYAADESVETVYSWDLATGSPGVSFSTRGYGFGLTLTSDVLVVTESSTGLVEFFSRLTGGTAYQTNRVGGIPRRPAVNAAGTVIVVPNESGWVDFMK